MQFLLDKVEVIENTMKTRYSKVYMTAKMLQPKIKKKCEFSGNSKLGLGIKINTI
jgi:hypothetical protein